MNYRSVSDLREDLREIAHELPPDIDLVVAIPRSGVLAANLLCLYLDVPMTDVDGLCRGDMFETGNRHEQSLSIDDIDTALVFDDSVYPGTQMAETRERVAGENFPFDLEYGAAYVIENGLDQVDHWGKVVPSPRVFEWNTLYHSNLENFCVDIDGVLCRDPTEAENDDGENYLEFLSGVAPKIRPNQRIGWLVTCRLEKYREETEVWLDEHGIEYDELVMMNHPDMEARREAGDHGAFKAEVYEETDAELFIESTPHQAVEICERTDKPIYCFETNELIQPGRIDETYQEETEYLSLFRENPVGFSIAAGEFLLRQVRARIK